MVSIIAIYCLHTVKWFQLLLFNSTNSIQYKPLVKSLVKYWTVLFELYIGKTCISKRYQSFIFYKKFYSENIPFIILITFYFLKGEFFQAVAVSILLYDCITWTLTKRLENRVDATYSMTLQAVFNNSWKQNRSCMATYLKTGIVRPLTSHLTNHPRKTSKTYWALLEK